MKRLHIVFLLASAARCGRHPPPAPAPGADTAQHRVGQATRGSGASTASPPAAPTAVEVGPDDLWRRADDGEEDDLARLADREGSEGLVERARSDGRARVTALRALAYADGHAALPFLAEAASGADDREAAAALESLADIAARPRRAIDPEDGAELRQGCDVLLALARDPSRPRARRIGAIRFLRMTIDHGCASATDIPTDLDAPK